MATNRDITIHQLETQEFHPVPKLFTRLMKYQWDTEKKQLIEMVYTSPYVALSSDAKLAYGVLYSRCRLSLYSYQQGKTDYVDEAGSVFLHYTVKELAKTLNVSKNTVIKIKKELIEAGLLREVKVGKNRPNRLYLQNVDATTQVTEYYDENETLLKRIDYFGNVLYEQEELSTVSTGDNTSQSLGKTGIPNLGLREVQTLGHQEVQDLGPNKKERNKKDIEYNISSRKAEQNSDEFSQPAGADKSSSQRQSDKYVPPEYYSLLNVIADSYNGKFCQYDLFTETFQNYSLTHRQKMLIGQYLTEGYVTSQEVIDLIEYHVPIDCQSPLAYILKSLENLKQERRLEAKIMAHRQAELKYSKQEDGDDDG